MAKKPTYEELEQRVKELENEAFERKQAEEALQKSEAQKKAILDASIDVIRLVDNEMRIIWANKTTTTELKAAPEQLVGNFCYETVAGRDTPCPGCPTKKTLKSGKAEHALMRQKELKGIKEETYWDDYAVPIKNESGDIVNLIQISRNITVRKLAEEALRESEEKYRSVVESTEDSIYLVDRDGTYLFANEKYLSRLGSPMEKVIGRTYGEFHSLDDTKEFVGKLEDVFETGQAIQQEHRSPRDNRYFLRTLSPIQGPDGNTTSVTVVSKDITDFKEAEEDLRQTNEELSRAHNQRKILSKWLIDLLEKDRRQIAMELHDHIGQTLTSLKIDLEVIHGQLDRAKPELGPRIKAVQEKAVQAVKDVKSVSQGLRPGMINALGLVSSLRGLFGEIQQQTDMDIHFFSRGVPKRFEREKELAIYRIAQEALTNIVRHSQAKNVFVNLVRKDNKLALSVEDDGVGFNQGKVMTFSKKKGPLGLLIMRERAEQLDGDFTLESQIGKGTHLLVEIPV